MNTLSIRCWLYLIRSTLLTHKLLCQGAALPMHLERERAELHVEAGKLTDALESESGRYEAA